LERHPIRWVINRSFSKKLNDSAMGLGLPARSRRFYATQEESSLNIGMWSPRLRGRAADDPAHFMICGFPDPWQVREAPTLSDEVENFLNAGDPPVVLGLGSALPRFVPEVYESTWKACCNLGQRAILVGIPAGVVDDPSNDLLVVPYAPYAALFPRAAVVMHHGGVGSLAEALCAGRPQVVIPCGADQYDNAARAERLGVARRIKRKQVSIRRLVESIRTCLTDSQMQSRALEVAERVSAEEDGAVVAARAVRDLLAS
jgi:UDP:flavonoid glycosyltransferase YjiC (YdhE family)